MNAEEKKERFIVTSALLYVNNVPHLGNLVCVVSADVFARYLKSRGKDVISVLGTDEHGTTTEIKALEEGLSPKEITDKYVKIHKKIYDFFLCKPDCFGRTSSEENKRITIELFNRLDENGYISEDEVDEYYCPRCNRVLADRFVKGKCKICGYDGARGDQCENCGSLLETGQLENPRCAICNGDVEIIKSRHLFLELPLLEDELRELLNSKRDMWSENAITMTEGWLNKGLQKRCITRDLKWGIPVPKKGYENKVFYSWFDAPIGYIGITAECRKEWKEWWKSEETRLVQFMGKDNIPFHSILFPAILIGSSEGYVLVDTLSVNEYLNYYGGKFSKSANRGLFGDDIVELGIRADAWRYYLMINRPEKADTDFTWDDFADKLNNELVANLGNLINRIMVFLDRNYGGILPHAELNEKDEAFFEEEKRLIENVENFFNRIQLKAALKEIMRISSLGNRYMQENSPWDESIPKERRDSSMNVLANLAKDLAILIEPFMPGISEDIFKQLNIQRLDWNSLMKPMLKEGHAVGKPIKLFSKISAQEIEELKRRFSEELHMEDKKCLELEVGLIKEAKEHPNADKLFVLKVDFGDEEIQLVAGLKKHYTKEELLGKKIIVVRNLKHAMLRGIESQGMLLAADDGNDVGLLSVDAEPGTLVSFEGEKKVRGCKELTIDELMENFSMKVINGEAFVNGKRMLADGKPVRAERIDNGRVR